MPKPTLTEATIRNLTTAQSFSRGQEYLRDGAVLEIEQRDDLLLATVEGSQYEPYQVQIRLDPGGIVDADCTCPYDWGGYCKHIVAVLLTFVQQPDQITERVPVLPLLSGLDRETLIDLLADLLAIHPHLADWVETRIAAREGARQGESEAAAVPRQRQTALDPEPFQRQVRSILRGLGQMRPSEAYWATSSTVDQVQEVMMQAQPFLEAVDGRNALVILEAVADEYVDTWSEFDDSDGDLGAFFGELGCMFAEALLSADLSPAERKSWAAKLSDWQAEIDAYGIDEGFDAAIGAAELGWDHPLLQRALAGQVTELGAWDDEAPWYADELTVARLNVLERQGRFEEYLNLAEAEGQTGLYVTMLVKAGRAKDAVAYGLARTTTCDEALALARSLRAHDHVHDALRVAEHGLSLPGSVTLLAPWLRDLASGLGENSLALKAARTAYTASPSLADYQAVQSLAGEDWPRIQPELLERLTQTSHTLTKVEIYLHEGLIEQAIRAVDQDRYPGYSVVEKVVDVAWESHPDWVIRQCKAQAEPIMDEAKSRLYHHAVRWLGKARQAYLGAGRSDEWRTYLEGLISKHNRKY
ncbi:MAG: SWIM zinc finger family protein [Anaerolineae bacterium]